MKSLLRKRKLQRSDYIERICKMIGIDYKESRKGYLSKKELESLLATLTILQDKIDESK